MSLLSACQVVGVGRELGLIGVVQWESVVSRGRGFFVVFYRVL